MTDQDAKLKGLQSMINSTVPNQGILVDRRDTKRKIGEKFVVRGLGVVQVVGYLKPFRLGATLACQISA